jgi:hypothetical protein
MDLGPRTERSRKKSQPAEARIEPGHREIKCSAKNLDSHWHAATVTRRRVSTQQQLSEQENSDLNYEQFNQKRNNFL